ncbi:MAG: hydroxymethylglutaryl-CoA lyase [Pseudomonadota bacterium]
MEQVEVFEVGPRDGLQNEPGDIPVADKVALIDHLSQAGFRRIEAASFVSPKKVPQMAGSSEVMAGITRVPGISYAALTPNMQGFDAACAAGMDEIAVFAAASEGFSKANINATIAESLSRFDPVAEAAKQMNIPMRGYISCITDCPYDGDVAPSQVVEVAKSLNALGCYEISLGDTLGHATPEKTDAVLAAVRDELPDVVFAGHYHDTAGRALENIEVSLSHGLRVFDAAIGGLGGCPYAPGAAGNVATGAVHQRLTELGYDTGLDAASLDIASDFVHSIRVPHGL